MRIAQTCPSNQWHRENFWNQVDHNEQQEARMAAAYDVPIDRDAIRGHVIEAILSYALPAGNA